MTTKKKSNAARLGALALALTLVSTCLMGGTMARYVTTVTGEANATVAAWSFKANDQSATLATIDLGSTTNRAKYEASGIKDGVIAPGTTGSFDIVIDGSGSGVGVDYAVTLKAADNITLPGNLIFKIDKGDGAEVAYTMGSSVGDTIAYAAGDGAMKKTLKVTWEWPFDALENQNDNDFAGKAWPLDITVTGKQTTLKPATP